MAESDGHEQFSPTTVGPERSWFDRFADVASGVVSEGPFFFGWVIAFGAWTAVGLVAGFSHPWMDLLVAVGVIMTLLMVALLENEQRRGDQAVQRKLNAIANALAEFMEREDVEQSQVDELRAAVGIEDRESTPTSGDRARKAFSQGGKDEPVEAPASSE